MDTYYSNDHEAYVIKLDNLFYLRKNGTVFKFFSSKLVEKGREWTVTDNFSYSDLPLTNILEQMQDIDKKLSENYIREILEYANTDLICYRVHSPKS